MSNQPRAVEKPKVIDWPTITVGGRSFMLRFSYSAHYLLGQYGASFAVNSPKPQPTWIQIAAACAGNFEPDGTWKSEGFQKAVHFADLIGPGDDETAIISACTEALKKAYPEAMITMVQAAPGETEEAPKTNSSTPGLLQSQEAA